MADWRDDERVVNYRNMLLGRFPQGVVGRDKALPELSLVGVTRSQDKAKGNLGFGVLDGVKSVDPRPYRDAKGEK
jgi:hypothetical protein